MARKMEARGAAAREDMTALKEFLEEGPEGQTSDQGKVEEPKSFFNWDSDEEDDEGFKVSQKRLRRENRERQPAGTDIDSSSGAKPGLRTLGNVLSAGKWFSGNENFTGIEAGSGDERVGTSSEGGLDTSGEAKRSSVLKLFDDPVWKAERGEALVNPCKISPQANIPRDGGYESIGDWAKRDAGATQVAGGANDEEGISCTDWAQHTYGNSTASGADRGSHASTESYVKSENQSNSEAKRQQKVFGKLSKIASLKNLKSKFTQTPIKAPPLPLGYEREPSVAQSPHTPKTPTKLRHEVKPDEAITEETDEFWTGEQCEQSLGEEGIMKDDSFFDWTQLLDENDKAQAKSAPHDPKAHGLGGNTPVTSVLTKSKHHSPEVLEKASPTPSSTVLSKSPGGLPKGPEDPGWDDAIKWVKSVTKEREKNEKKAAQDLKKLRAGKDAVKRYSQLGYTPNKAIDEMTQEEFEAVGMADTTPSPKGKKTGIFDALFSKMRGSKKEQEEQASVIDRQLHEHRSLQPLKSATAKDVNDSTPEDQVHYDKAMHLLEGVGYEENSLVSPFDATRRDEGAARTAASTPAEERARALSMLQGSSLQSNSSSASTDGVGLGILTQSQDQLDEYDRRAARMTVSEFLEFRRQQQISTGDNGNGSWQQRAARDAAESSAGASSDAKNEEQHDAPTLSSLEGSDFVNEIADFDGMTGSYHPNLIDFTSQVDRYLGATQTHPAIPRRPLLVQEHRERDAGSGDLTPYRRPDALTASAEAFFRRSASKLNSTPEVSTIADTYDEKDDDGSSSVYSQDLTDDVLPAPLNVPILKVKGSSPNIGFADSNAFIPERSGSFTEKINEASRHREPKLSSHPALREPAEPSQLRKDQDKSTSDVDRVDSGTGLPMSHNAGEGHATAVVDRSESAPTNQPNAKKLVMELKENDKWQWKTPKNKDNDAGELVGDIGLQELRSSLGLPAQRSPKPGQLRHPSHPYSWNHEKIMCKWIHNPAIEQPQLPRIPENVPLNMSLVGSRYFNSSSPSKSQTTEAKTCRSCGTACCRYATLFYTSKAPPSIRLMDEMVRNTAKQCVASLRTTSPNGLEEFETFLVCHGCGRRICPDCAIKCDEEACQAIVCKICMTQSKECPVHNY